jgi:hypothetical protein
MSSDFNTWWRDIGSGIRPLARHDYEQHGQRISMLAWNDSSVRATADITRLRAELAQRTAERDALAAEVAALKAQPDPLAEMWRELAEYQPFADRDGHGDSWRAMCAERTDAAAHAAALAAAWASPAATAAEWAKYAAFALSNAGQPEAESAIAAIRRAKEGQR